MDVATELHGHHVPAAPSHRSPLRAHHRVAALSSLMRTSTPIIHPRRQLLILLLVLVLEKLIIK
jgi:hypothetical protein